MKIKGLKITREEGEQVYFKQGVYNTQTGLATYTVTDLPFVLKKMTSLHKASTNDPLYWLNIFFGLSLLFFVISSFWMFLPKTKMFRKGMYFTLAGIVFSLILIFI